MLLEEWHDALQYLGGQTHSPSLLGFGGRLEKPPCILTQGEAGEEERGWRRQSFGWHADQPLSVTACQCPCVQWVRQLPRNTLTQPGSGVRCCRCAVGGGETDCKGGSVFCWGLCVKRAIGESDAHRLHSRAWQYRRFQLDHFNTRRYQRDFRARRASCFHFYLFWS